MESGIGATCARGSELAELLWIPTKAAYEVGPRPLAGVLHDRHAVLNLLKFTFLFDFLRRSRYRPHPCLIRLRHHAVLSCNLFDPCQKSGWLASFAPDLYCRADGQPTLVFEYSPRSVSKQPVI